MKKITKYLVIPGIILGLSAALTSSFLVGAWSGKKERKNKDIASQLTYNVAGDDKVISLDEKKEFLSGVGYTGVMDESDRLSFVGNSRGVTAYLNHARSFGRGVFENTVESCSYEKRLSNEDISRVLGN